jgi:hypothetical protein
MSTVTDTKAVRALLEAIRELPSGDTRARFEAMNRLVEYVGGLCDDVDFLQSIISDLKADSDTYQMGYADGLSKVLQEFHTALKEMMVKYPAPAPVDTLSFTTTDRTEPLP